MEAAQDTLRYTIFTFLSRNLSIFSHETLWELDSKIGNYVSWGIFTEMKQSIISPKKTFQLPEQTHTAMSIPRHTDATIKSDQEDTAKCCFPVYFRHCGHDYLVFVRISEFPALNKNKWNNIMRKQLGTSRMRVRLQDHGLVLFKMLRS